MGSVVRQENKQSDSLLNSFDALSFCAQTQSCIDSVIHVLSIISEMTFTSSALINDYVSQVEECEIHVGRLRSLDCSDAVFLELKNECLKRFSAFEADRAGEFSVTHKESVFDFKA